MPTAVVTGITGQDGAYLAQLLLERGYDVVGAYRRTSSVNHWRLIEVGVLRQPKLKLVEYDLLDPGASCRLIERHQPDMVFNLAAQSFVGVSFDQPAATAQYSGVAVTNLLEAIRIVKPDTRFYQASTSEMFGLVQAVPQSETTPFYPRSPYAAAKLYGHWMTVNYREAYGLFASSGILFNHESPLRGQEFVTRKISNSVARIHLGLQERLELGNLDAQRDWGHAREYVDGMLRMLLHDKPDTFVLATGKTWRIRQFVEMAFAAVDVSVNWKGEGADEIGVCASTGKTLVAIDPAFFRPAEVDLLIGDPSKAKAQLGWEAQCGLEALCVEMVEADIQRNRNGASF